jgi:hypothetical protein
VIALLSWLFDEAQHAAECASPLKIYYYDIDSRYTKTRRAVAMGQSQGLPRFRLLKLKS